MWSDLNVLLSVKIECHKEDKADTGGIMSINKGAEMFTLSWINLDLLKCVRIVEVQMELSFHFIHRGGAKPAIIQKSV